MTDSLYHFESETTHDLRNIDDVDLVEGITNAQRRALRWIHSGIARHQGGAHDKPEFKEFKVSVRQTQIFPDSKLRTSVVVWSVFGGADDEGTWGSILCRDRRHIVIGVRGGARLLNPGRFDKRLGRIVPSRAKVRGGRVTWALTPS